MSVGSGSKSDRVYILSLPYVCACVRKADMCLFRVLLVCQGSRPWGSYVPHPMEPRSVCSVSVSIDMI